MKIKVTDWSDDAYKRTKKATGKAESEVIAEVEVERFAGFSFDGGRLEISGHPETIWITSHQWSLYVDPAQIVALCPACITERGCTDRGECLNSGKRLAAQTGEKTK